MVKGLLILGVGLIALIDAAISLYRGGNEVSAGLALAYATFATVLCGVIYLALRRARRAGHRASSCRATSRTGSSI